MLFGLRLTAHLFLRLSSVTITLTLLFFCRAEYSFVAMTGKDIRQVWCNMPTCPTLYSATTSCCFIVSFLMNKSQVPPILVGLINSALTFRWMTKQLNWFQFSGCHAADVLEARNPLQTIIQHML